MISLSSALSDLGRVDESAIVVSDSHRLLSSLKQLYDLSSLEFESKHYGPFDYLEVSGFENDAETIWEELQTRNRPLNRALKVSMSLLQKRLSQFTAEV